jgi:hypothetical protein
VNHPALGQCPPTPLTCVRPVNGKSDAGVKLTTFPDTPVTVTCCHGELEYMPLGMIFSTMPVVIPVVPSRVIDVAPAEAAAWQVAVRAVLPGFNVNVVIVFEPFFNDGL